MGDFIDKVLELIRTSKIDTDAFEKLSGKDPEEISREDVREINSEKLESYKKYMDE